MSQQHWEFGPREAVWFLLTVGVLAVVVASSCIVAEDPRPSTRYTFLMAFASGAVLVLGGVWELRRAGANARRASTTTASRAQPGEVPTTEERDDTQRADARRREDLEQARWDIFWAWAVVIIGGLFASYAGLVGLWTRILH